jgi:fructosamine-3-kinase
MPNQYVTDERWSQLFSELRIALRELRDLEPRVADGGASDEEWTKAWGEFSGLVSRIGHLQQQLLRRRMELLDLSR